MSTQNRQLRILHIISGDLWAGAEVQAYTLIKELQKNAALHVVLMNYGTLENKIIDLGLQPTVLDERKLTAWQIIRGIMHCIQHFAPDVIHTHRQKENILASIANVLCAKSIAKLTPSVRTCHGAPEFSTKGLRKLQVYIDTFVGRHLQHAVIAVSQDLKAKLAKIFDLKSIHVIENGVSIEHSPASVASFAWETGNNLSRHVGIIGRLTPVKRVDIFIGMAALIHKSHPELNLQFHIIGDGNLKNNLMEQAQSLKLTPILQFHGHIADIATYITHLDALIMCSDHEGTPMVALESLALGTPVIAHDVGGLSELLKVYPSMRVSDHSPEGYAKKLVNYLTTEAISVKLPDEYSSRINGEKTLALYVALAR